ncbi:MAG: hypothetical protein SOR73_13260 [Romboutsia timonensis]|uniref:hypothetical protein n=1 Tax=Romboutsia timonensis TaxID=1776391 RepID=UPI002A749D3C|nr:hypothetical protein [Romboutsia timonensis]MDY3002623.1 hypothetical protein [Romboutsia timonensis]
MIKKKTESIKLSKYIEIQKAEYTHIQVIPSKSCRNTNTDKILVLANTMYKKLDRLIRIENKKLIITSKLKLSYYIHITKRCTEFYFIVPTVFYSQVKTKLSEIWKNVEIKKVNALPININDCTKYQLSYKLNDVLSLNVDKRSNSLLNANLSVLEILQNQESVGIFYNFIPMSQKEQNYFKISSQEALNNFKQGMNLKKTKNIVDLGVISLKFLVDFINGLLNAFLNTSKNTHNIINPIEKTASSSTQRKAKSDIIKTQAIICAKSNEKEREKQLCTTTFNTFSSVSDDNELEMEEVKKNIDIYRDDIKVKSNYTSTLEAGKFVNVAGKDIIEQHKNIKHNKVLELRAPKCLEHGEIRIGTVKCKGSNEMSYFSSHYEIKKAERVLIGPKGSGKSYKSEQLAKDAIKAGRGVVIIDIIEDCKMSRNIYNAVADPSKIIRINCADISSIQAFSYNEITMNDTMEPMQVVSNAIKRGQQLQNLLNCINEDVSKLTPRMIKYFYAACAIVYCVKYNASLGDIRDCLSSPEEREKYINSIPDKYKELLENRIKNIRELDKKEKNKISNYDIKIDGILDRLALLEISLESEIALSKTSETNINLCDAIQQNKIILIEIPEDVFTSKMIKDVMTTFYTSKIWCAKKQLSKNQKTLTEMFFDEFYKCPNTTIVFEEMFEEARKYNLINTVTLHSFLQLNNKCRNLLKAGGASYMLLYGCDIYNYDYLKKDFNNNGYTEEDLLNLNEHEALCLIRNEDKNYSSFICKIPA